MNPSRMHGVKLGTIHAPTLPKVKVRKAHVRFLHAALLRSALVLFICDLLACGWPWFGAWWEHREHLGVATASVLVTIGEWVNDKVEGWRKD